ncbi:MAG: hypothetical protein HC800_09945 [Phormidesmis sp. RL_2_1]|nr:hypothetical protein [Phormidesmis sp. RL_2_1]
MQVSALNRYATPAMYASAISSALPLNLPFHLLLTLLLHLLLRAVADRMRQFLGYLS